MLQLDQRVDGDQEQEHASRSNESSCPRDERRNRITAAKGRQIRHKLEHDAGGRVPPHLGHQHSSAEEDLRV